MDEEKRKTVADATILGMLPLWASNFAHNVPYILNLKCPSCNHRYDESTYECKDTRELKPIGGPAIIIGASPAIDKLKHLEMLAASDFKGTIIATDKMLIPCLKAGIVPNFVCSVDGASEIVKFYRHMLVDYHKDGIKAIFNSMVSPELFREFKGQKYTFHSTLDKDGPTSLTRAMHYMTHSSVIPGTGDVGGFCTQIAIGLDCNPICFIGLSYGSYEIEELADYMAYIRDVPKEHQMLEKLFWRHFNPDFDNYCWTSMLWESCWDTVKERLEFYHEKKGIRFINASGMGLIESPYAECMSFEEALRVMK